jgi:hypothetical protein
MVQLYLHFPIRLHAVLLNLLNIGTALPSITRSNKSLTNEEKRNACRLFVGKPKGKRPLGRPRRRWVDNIRMDLGEIEWGGVGWIGLARHRDRWRALVNAVMNRQVP